MDGKLSIPFLFKNKMQIVSNSFRIKRELAKLQKEMPKAINKVLTTVSIALKKKSKSALKRNELGMIALNPLTIKFRKKKRLSGGKTYGGKLNSGIKSFAKNGKATIEWTSGLAKMGTLYGKRFKRTRTNSEIHQMFRYGLIKKYKSKKRTQDAIKAVRKYFHPKRIFWKEFLNWNQTDKYIYGVIKGRIKSLVEQASKGAK